MSEQLLDMSVVRIDGDTQPRTAINPGIVQEYAEAMQAGVEFPPVIVVHDGATYWLVDGFRRFFAHRRLSRQQIKADVVAGELTDARWLSVAANKTRGLRRTNEDKAAAIMRALGLRPDMSNVAIAEHVGVSEAMVRRYREILKQKKADQVATVATSQMHVEYLADEMRAGRWQHTRQGNAFSASRVLFDGERHPARSAKRRGARRAGRIARNAFRPVRTGTEPARMTALSMPHDPIMGARTLIELFNADYLRALVTFLTKHLA